MIQIIQTTTTAAHAPNPQPTTTRDRIERARALVIAQFGARVLVDPDDYRGQLPARAR